MSATKESAIQHLRSTRLTYHVLSVLGLPLGYAISYWFQPSALRSKCSLWNYFLHIKDVLTEKDLAPTAIIVTLIVVVLMDCLGRWLTSQARLTASSVLTEEEIQKNAGKNTAPGDIVFGKIKEGEDNLGGSVKRIVKMLFIGLGIIFLLMMLIIFLAVVFSGNPK